MAILKQSTDGKKFYYGWYGNCHGDADCDSLDLITGEPQNAVHVYPEIFKVYEVAKTTIGEQSYSGELNEGPELYFGSQIKELKCGMAYKIILKEGTEEVNIPEFVYADANLYDEIDSQQNINRQIIEDCVNCFTPTPTPTQTPTPMDCGVIFENAISTDGNTTPCADCGISGFTFGAFHGPNSPFEVSDPGILYFDDVHDSKVPLHTTFALKLEDQEIFGSVTISFELINRRIVYKDPFDNLYEVILQDTFDVQIMQKIDGCYPLTSLPINIPSNNECEDFDNSVLITKEMSDTSEILSFRGISISGFEEGGVVCINELEETIESTVCPFATEDFSIMGFITLAQKSTDSIIIYKSKSGELYQGQLIDSPIGGRSLLTKLT